MVDEEGDWKRSLATEKRDHEESVDPERPGQKSAAEHRSQPVGHLEVVSQRLLGELHRARYRRRGAALVGERDKKSQSKGSLGRGRT